MGDHHVTVREEVHAYAGGIAAEFRWDPDTSSPDV